MNLDKILTISGKSDLYELISQTRIGFVVKSIIDNKKTSINLQNKISMLSEISIDIDGGEMPLKEVLEKIKSFENGNQTSIAENASKADLEEYFFKVVPNYDEDKVYASDIKKIIRWYNLLNKKGLLNESEEKKENKEEK